jgi:hypothetical protein
MLLWLISIVSGRLRNCTRPNNSYYAIVVVQIDLNGISLMSFRIVVDLITIRHAGPTLIKVTMQMKKIISSAKYLLLSLVAIYVIYVFVPRKYEVPSIHERAGTQYWNLATVPG